MGNRMLQISEILHILNVKVFIETAAPVSVTNRKIIEYSQCAGRTMLLAFTNGKQVAS